MYYIVGMFLHISFDVHTLKTYIYIYIYTYQTTEVVVSNRFVAIQIARQIF